MGSSQTKQTIDNINSSISKSILKSLQQYQSDVNIKQGIYAKCSSNDIKTISKGYIDCIIKYIDNNDPDETLKLCSLYTDVCKVNNVQLSSFIDINILTTQTEQIVQTTKNNIKNSLSQYSSGTSTDQYIKNIVDNTSNIINNINQYIKKNSNLVQTIKLEGGYNANGVSINSVQTIVNNIVQSDTVTSSNVNDIANTISQVNIQGEKSVYNTLLYIIIILIVAYVCITIIMILHRSDDASDFFHHLIPMLIFIIASTTITVILILFKPKFVTFNEKNKETLSRKKLFYILAPTYLILGIITIIISKYKLFQ
jgi:hypothetical protein